MNLFRQIKILDTKNYTNDAILREKIEENNADYLKQKFQYKGNEYVYAKYEDKNELKINIVDSHGKQIYYHFENENMTVKTVDPLRLNEKFFKELQKEDIIDKFEKYDLYEIGNQIEVLYEKYKNEDNHDLELFDSKKDNENEEKSFFVKKNGENFIVNHDVKDNKGVCDESFLISKYNQGENGLYSMTFMSQFLSRRDEAQTKTIKLKTGFTLYNEENKNIPLIIDDINKKFNQFFDKNGKDSYFMMIKNGDEIEIKNFENDYKIKNDGKHQNVYFIKDNKEIPIYSDYKDNIVGTDICSREVNKELFTENLFNFLKSEENKSGLIKFDYDNYDSLLKNSIEIKEKECEELNEER